MSQPTRGFKVRCVNNKRIKHALTVGDEYLVEGTLTNIYVSGHRCPLAYAVVCDDGVERVYSATRFINPTTTSPSMENNFQPRVAQWMLETFGPEVSVDYRERGFRFGEEALELLQANGTTKEEVLKLVDYVYSRPVGELYQEVGGTMVTLGALCQAWGIDLLQAGHAEQTRCELPEVRAKIQAKQADKRARMQDSPLPGSAE